jgi:Flp pilus assembly protein TadD
VRTQNPLPKAGKTLARRRWSGFAIEAARTGCYSCSIPEIAQSASRGEMTMLANHYRALFAACLAATLAGQACQTTRDPAVQEDAAGARPPIDSKTALKEARYLEAVKGLDFDTGLVVVVEGTGDDVALARSYRDQGLDRLQKNQLTGALTLLAKAVRTDPQDAEAYESLGRALQVKGKDEPALAAFRTALTLDPDFVDAQYGLATQLARLGRRSEAIPEMERVLELDPQNARAHERLAIWYYYEEDPETAWQHVHAARDLGRPPPPQFIALLEAQMPDPGR